MRAGTFGRWLGLGLALLLATDAGAAEVSAQLDRTTARVGDQVGLTVTAVGAARSVPEIQLAGLEADFQVYNAGQSQSFNMVNGKVSVQTSRTVVLIPKHEGTFTIGPLEVRVGNDVFRTQPLTLTVTGSPPAPTPPPEGEDEVGSTRGSEDLFVRASVDRGEAYLYQQIILRIRLFYRVDLLDSPGYSAPPVEGFWKEDLTPPNISTETVNGKRYRVLETRMALFPTRPGKLTVGEAVLECAVVDPTRPRDPFSFFGGSLRDGKRVILRSDPIPVEVKPLPPGAPLGFQGAVGDYRLQVDADRRELNQTEPLTLTVRVSGSGHLRTVGEIRLPPLPAFRAYPSTANQVQKPEGDRIQGALTQQFVLVPLRAGDLTVPPVEFSYFDPKEGAYRTLRSDPVAVHASAGAPEVPGTGRGEIEMVGRDIRFLETDVPRFTARRGAWDAARPWLTFLPAPVLGFAGLWAIETRRRQQGADRAGRRRAGARRRARARLDRAKGVPPAEQARAAGEAIRGFLADRCDLSEAGLTPDSIRAAIVGMGADPAPALEFLERTDAARYAPLESRGQGWIEEAARVLAGLERSS